MVSFLVLDFAGILWLMPGWFLNPCFFFFPCMAGGYPRTGLDSQDQPEDDGIGMAEGSTRFESGHDTSSSKPHGVGGIGGGSFTSSKLKKKKKTKAFPGLSNSRPYEGGLGAGPPGKVFRPT